MLHKQYQMQLSHPLFAKASLFKPGVLETAKHGVKNKAIIYSQKANNFGYVEYNSQVTSTPVYVNGTSAGRREIIIRLKVIKSELRFPPSRDYCCMFSRCTASPLDFLFEIEIVSLTVGLNKQANPSPVDRGCRSKYSPILNASHITFIQTCGISSI